MAIKRTTKSKQTRQAQSNFKKWEKEQNGYKAKGESFLFQCLPRIIKVSVNGMYLTRVQ